MMDFFVPELVNAVMAERSKEADSMRVAAEVGRGNPKPRLRPRVALALGDLAARIHPEAARHAVGLRAPRSHTSSGGHGRMLCVCESDG